MFDWSTYPLPSGTVTELGEIEQVSLTAYKIAGAWHAFTAIHGPRGWAEPLVRLS